MRDTDLKLFTTKLKTLFPKVFPSSPLRNNSVFSGQASWGYSLKKKFLKYSWLTMLCRSLLCHSAKWLLYAYIDIIFKIFFSIKTYHKVLNRVPCGPCCLSILNVIVCIPEVILASSLSLLQSRASHSLTPMPTWPHLLMLFCCSCVWPVFFCPSSCHSLYTRDRLNATSSDLLSMSFLSTCLCVCIWEYILVSHKQWKQKLLKMSNKNMSISEES